MPKQLLFAALIFQLFACSSTSNNNQPVIPPASISKDMMSWLYYDRDYMQWSADFKALDTSSQPIEKSEFLHRLATGNYLPVKIQTGDSSLCYQLYPVESTVYRGIREAIKGKAEVAYRYLQLKGNSLPGFNFVDLNGNTYNAETTKGKIVVLNCWYIGCLSCNKEMPDLNKIVDQAKTRNDVVFLGLAFDSADSLKQFLTKKEFKYAVVPEKESYLREDLGIIYYPTHIIVNRRGKIVRVIDGSVKELIDALNEEFKKNS